MLPTRKFIWLDGSEHDIPDPNWNEDEARRRGLVASSSVTFASRQVDPKPHPILEAIQRRDAELLSASIDNH
jgi:hypothetical protein